MNLQFFESPVLPYGRLICFHNDKCKDDKYSLDIIKKIYFDKPFTFEQVCIENGLIPLDISKKFSDELIMKNWLINQNYNKIFSNDDYELFTKELYHIKRFETYSKSVPIYAVWIKEK